MSERDRMPESVRRLRGDKVLDELAAKFFPTYAEIESGPSKFDLSVSLLYGDDQMQERQPVYFTLKEPINGQKRMTVLIDSLSREGGCGESWNFTGMMTRHSCDKLGGSTAVKSKVTSLRTVDGVICHSPCSKQGQSPIRLMQAAFGRPLLCRFTLFVYLRSYFRNTK